MIGNLLNYSLEGLKRKNLFKVGSYNSFVRCCLANNIDIVTNNKLKDMKDNKVEMDFIIFLTFIEIYGKRGDMKSVQNIFKVLNEAQYLLNFSIKAIIYCGFIRAKQFKGVEAFVKEENLNTNDEGF